MRILVIGGTIFLGRHLVEAALSAGHSVTLFNRQKSNPELFDVVENLRGDRETDLHVLAGREWDAVIDTCGYLPRVVALSAAALRGSCACYVFISSVSVYQDLSQPGVDERSPLAVLTKDTEEVGGESYGPQKALCEKRVQEHYPDSSLIVRPGLIVGPYDPTDRFSYWPLRIDRGGTVLAPGSPQRLVQFIDARDLAAWIIESIERGVRGTFNACGPTAPTTMGDLLECCCSVASTEARLFWVEDDELSRLDVQPWVELPLWVPEGHEFSGIGSVDFSRALEQGLRSRDQQETISDTIEWLKEEGVELGLRAGLSPAREQELLSKLQERV